MHYEGRPMLRRYMCTACKHQHVRQSHRDAATGPQAQACLAREVAVVLFIVVPGHGGLADQQARPPHLAVQPVPARRGGQVLPYG